ncbi:pyridine nucleotide-disulfide oxidoreductase [Eubacterium sulci ATCC 35585]|jgi:sarcosine oxidase alpha subunit|nr:pyridine nucleotide-disulfide oxidoreductase [Eubacterium sulci ATCC 35585]MBF1138868.1 FAD-dependent oxidoreductase [[Eubacterium] sulci]EUC78777.1 pyridine nucleotide-disulfide oxidoreductase [Eubacterium sulci ATCC 35585]MBF1156656.1 FAD-dependent oxidoreductase [[Eubacterium] sulci]MBF1162491.1 FAD-dependent oxidoreductase [[Eubacterium] sulci]
MRHCQAVVIGGGCGGLAAAAKLKQEGLKDVVLIEKDAELGGVLNQCIHNGFGLTTFKEQLSGPSFAERYEDQVVEAGVEVKLNTMVTHMSSDRIIEYVNQEEGYQKLQADIIILSVGCYERSRGALAISGERPTGVYTAGQAQRYLNIDGYMVGKSVFILGSGDIGLIMARRMSLEGAKVLGVAELMPYSNGLPRNMKQCLDDFGIPLYLSHTVTNVYGEDRLEKIELAKVDENRNPIPGSEMYFDVDTLLLSVGLIPENSLAEEAGIDMDMSTRGPIVDENYMTSVPGIFACGNGLHVHDLADFVTKQAGEAALGALRYLNGSGGDYSSIKAGNLIGYVVPAKLHKENLPKTVTLYFRVRKPLTDVTIEISKGGKVIRSIHKDHLIPSEMEQVIIANSMLEDAEGDLLVQIKES